MKMQTRSYIELISGQKRYIPDPTRKSLAVRNKNNREAIIEEIKKDFEKQKAEDAKKALWKARFESLPKTVQVGLKALFKLSF